METEPELEMEIETIKQFANIKYFSYIPDDTIENNGIYTRTTVKKGKKSIILTITIYKEYFDGYLQIAKINKIIYDKYEVNT